MNYQRIYNEIIENARKLNRKKKQGIYYENHHIIARCMGGNDSTENLVLLSAREHFLCHKLLHRIYPDNKSIFFAYSCMTMSLHGRRIIISAREFEYIKEMKSKLNSKDSISENCRRRHKELMTGRKHTEEHNQKISKTLKSRGLVRSDDFKESVSKKNKGKIDPPEARRKRSETIRKKYKEERHFNARKILFDGMVYDRYGDITKELGFCNRTIHKIMNKMILEGNPNYNFLE